MSLVGSSPPQLQTSVTEASPARSALEEVWSGLGESTQAGSLEVGVEDQTETAALEEKLFWEVCLALSLEPSPVFGTKKMLTERLNG